MLVQALFRLKILLGVLEASQCHLGLGNPDRRLGRRGNLLILALRLRSVLLRHDWLAFENVLEIFIANGLDSLGERDGRHSESFGLLETSSDRGLVNLLVLRHLISAFCIDIVRKHVLAVVDPTVRWVCVALTVGVEGWLAEVGHEGGVGQPSGGVVEVRLPTFHLGSLLLLLGSHRLCGCLRLLGLSLALEVLIDLDILPLLVLNLLFNDLFLLDDLLLLLVIEDSVLVSVFCEPAQLFIFGLLSCPDLLAFLVLLSDSKCLVYEAPDPLGLSECSLFVVRILLPVPFKGTPAVIASELLKVARLLVPIVS